MKKTCNECRAEIRINKVLRCEFGYPVRQYTKFRGAYIGIKPEEKCPKPKTWNEYRRQVKLLSGGK